MLELIIGAFGNGGCDAAGVGRSSIKPLLRRAPRAAPAHDRTGDHARVGSVDVVVTQTICSPAKGFLHFLLATPFLMKDTPRTHNDSVLMFKTNADHDHDEKKEFTSSYGLSDTVKNEINRLFDLKMKPKAIMESLSKIKNIKVPKMSQLRNYLSDRRRTIYGQSTISLGELEA
ncbi:hypothetical protein EVAR_32813_1 [Eumeta japonica]|uniref:Uncharacterized protein n=1 Tax=Eumeta variegata TaxID=151549 RepID=A0A4C1WED6_EUMVA|nr:hypothetical protein EVAR_32813_1 [Eumeta japonica]